MISIQNLNKYYGTLHVLHDVNLQLHKGECVAFIGPNGCGKTTLMKCILGLVTPKGGQVLVEQKNIQKHPQQRSKLGFMSQNSVFPKNMTVGNILDTMKNIRHYQGELDMELYEAYRIYDILNKKAGALSGGTCQKLNATLAFMFNPQILILDEPTASLDPIAAQILRQKIRKESMHGKLVCITSHLLSELDDLVNSIVFMEEGRIVLHQSISDILQTTGCHTLTQAMLSILQK